MIYLEILMVNNSVTNQFFSILLVFSITFIVPLVVDIKADNYE